MDEFRITDREIVSETRVVIWATIRLPVPIPVLVDILRPLTEWATKHDKELLTRQVGQFIEVYDDGKEL